MIPIIKNHIYAVDLEVKPLPEYEYKYNNKNDEQDEEQELHVDNPNFLPWCCQIYGMSIAWGYEYEESAYFTGDDIEKVVTILSINKLNLAAHNVFFDWSNLAYKYEKPLNFIADSGVISQALNNSDFVNSFGLKQTIQRQYNIETQDVEIKTYLKLHHKIAESKYGAFIHLCPEEMIEKYCRLDSVYCWRLIHDSKKWLKSDISQYMALYLNEVEITILQFIEGILVDREGFKIEKIRVQEEFDSIEQRFFNNSDLIPFIEKVQKERFDKEQSKLKKKILEFTEWSSKNKFNINSTAQLKMLFDAQGLYWNKEKNKFIYPHTNLHVKTKINNLKSPKLGTKFLYLYGIGGEILEDKSQKKTLIQNIDKALEESELTGRIHPHINMLGTKSGRISASGVNIVATPIKKEAYGKNLIVEDGWILFSADFKALEPTLLACLSNDPVLKYITFEGEGKEPFIKNDILYIDDTYISSAYSAPFMKSEIEKIDLTNWVNDPEHEKKKVKVTRSISKTIVLSTIYGAGSLKVQGKIREDMRITVPIKNIEVFQDAYWNTFIEAAYYKRQLENEARQNGYLINIGGYPLIFYNRVGGAIQGTHKSLNRMIQSSAAVVMKLLLSCLYSRIKNDRNIFPQVCDWHDAFHGKCKIDYIERTKYLLNESLAELNDILNLSLKFRLDFNYGKNFYEAKG